MERGKLYTYITKILLVKPLIQKKYFQKQSAWKLAYLYVIFVKRLWTEILEESHLFLNSPRMYQDFYVDRQSVDSWQRRLRSLT
jgi:hypothetical protein